MIITLKDGTKKEYAEAMSVYDIARDISEGLARVACAGESNGEVVDLRTVVDKDCELNILTFERTRKDWLHSATPHAILWHRQSSVCTRDAKLAIGPSIADGFYYDIDFETPLTADDLEKIEAEMKKIVKENLALERFTLPREEAIAFMKEKEEPYKVELIEDLPEDAEISFYQQGEFVDLCAGPHLMNTKTGKGLQAHQPGRCLLERQREKQDADPYLRYCFTKKESWKNTLTRIEEAKKRDHRKLGKELGIFMMREEGPGFPFFLPKGMVLKNTLLDYWREIHNKAGYVEISTPIMLNRQLWETSGHWDHYKDNMYTTVIDDQDYAIKPMNCPGGVLVYASEPRSYRDLPLRMGELGTGTPS